MSAYFCSCKSFEMSSVFWWNGATRSNCSAISATTSDLTERERKAWQMFKEKAVFWGHSSLPFIWHGPCVTRWSANRSERCCLEYSTRKEEKWNVQLSQSKRRKKNRGKTLKHYFCVHSLFKFSSGEGLSIKIPLVCFVKRVDAGEKKN